MTRAVTSVIAAALLASPSARADPPPPTKEQLDDAKKAFDEAKRLYDGGKLLDAVEKLKESYRLSHNAFLLYNIGHTYDQAGEKEKALYFYARFLEAAPANAPMHDDVVKRVEALKAEGIVEDAGAAQAITKPIEFQHRVVESAPPGKPVEITAIVPENAALVITLSYRASGEELFTSTAMSRRGAEVVAEIPAGKVVAGTLQYYIDVRDQSGNVVARSGRPTSPNLVAIETAPARVTHDSTEDPLRAAFEVHAAPEPPPRFAKRTWIASGAAVALVGSAITTYAMARHESNLLRADSTSCGAPPCRTFDQPYDQQVQTLGIRYNRIYEVSAVLGLAALGVAGYFWYHDLFLAPTIDHGVGAAAVARF